VAKCVVASLVALAAVAFGVSASLAGGLEIEAPEEESCFCDVARTEKEEMRKYLEEREAKQEAEAADTNDSEAGVPVEEPQAED
jgi:hypothetical protein